MKEKANHNGHCLYCGKESKQPFCNRECYRAYVKYQKAVSIHIAILNALAVNVMQTKREMCVGKLDCLVNNILYIPPPVAILTDFLLFVTARFPTRRINFGV